MKLAEILNEAPVSPDRNILETMDWILDEVNAQYAQFLKDNDDEDDIDYLCEIMEEYIEDEGLPIEVHVDPTEKKDPNAWISAMAGKDEDGSFMQIILNEYNLKGKWGPETFKTIVMQAIQHETIHLGQYAKIPDISKVKSGHVKGTELKKKTGKERDWMRSYLRDPHELMAYANDLASEILEYDRPYDVLSNPEQYISELPTYQRFRAIFPKDSKQVKQLLKYAYQYLESRKDEIYQEESIEELKKLAGI